MPVRNSAIGCLLCPSDKHTSLNKSLEQNGGKWIHTVPRSLTNFRFIIHVRYVYLREKGNSTTIVIVLKERYTFLVCLFFLSFTPSFARHCPPHFLADFLYVLPFILLPPSFCFRSAFLVPSLYVPSFLSCTFLSVFPVTLAGAKERNFISVYRDIMYVRWVWERPPCTCLWYVAIESNICDRKGQKHLRHVDNDGRKATKRKTSSLVQIFRMFVACVAGIQRGGRVWG